MARSKAILWVVLIAQFMVVLDATIVTVALPSIQSGLHFDSQTQLQWVINAYALMFGGFLLFGGRAGDLLGRQRLFVIGLALFGISSLVNGLAQNPETLIVGRAVQGLGGALVSPAVLSIIIVTFESMAERAKAFGLFSAVTASGAGAGILAGGILTEWLSWRAIFLVNVPIAVFAIIGALRLVPNSRAQAEGRKRLDVPGAVTITGSLLLLVYGVVNAATWGWGSGKVWAYVGAAAVLLVAFLVIESVSKQPLVRLGIFKTRPLGVSNLAMMLFMAGLFVNMFFLPLYMAQIKGYSAIEVGLAYLPWPVVMAFSSTVAQKLMPRFGPKHLMWIGLLITAVGMYMFSQQGPTDSYATGVLPGVILTAIGGGFAWGGLFLVSGVGVKPEESGLAGGLINTSQQLGTAVGLAVLSSVAAAYTKSLTGSGTAVNDALSKGWDRGYLIAAVILVVGAAVILVGLRSSDGRHAPAAATAEPEIGAIPVVPLEPVMGD
jgi:EmrB/QacA subfamily drug resistance transporter